jgi:DNA (cytosine-5)-methyltransferase 1
MYKVLDLFSGIGGFSYGLELTGGFRTVGFCEIDEEARKVLKNHWPNVKQYTDIKELTYEKLQADGIEPNVITGGFPCQDISLAGKGKGIIGERSSLWSEYARLIDDVRPKWAIIENVSSLRSRGLTLVLQDLSEIGYDAEWHCIPASAVGAPHRRDRVWIIAYPREEGTHMADSERLGWQEGSSQSREFETEEASSKFNNGSEGRRVRETSNDVADSESERLEGLNESSSKGSDRGKEKTYIRNEGSRIPIVGREAIEAFATSFKFHWSTEPNVGRVANGVPNRVHRLKQLGNSVVPQIPRLLGHCILSQPRGSDVAKSIAD